MDLCSPQRSLTRTRCLGQQVLQRSEIERLRETAPLCAPRTLMGTVKVEGAEHAHERAPRTLARKNLSAPYQANGSNAKPMAPTCAESSDPPGRGRASLSPDGDASGERDADKENRANGTMGRSGEKGAAHAGTWARQARDSTAQVLPLSNQPSGEETTQKFLRTFTWKPRPNSGVFCLMFAIFAFQRGGR